MDISKLRPSRNIEDRRNETKYSVYEGKKKYMDDSDDRPDVSNIPAKDTNPNGWESVNKDYSKEKRR